MGRSSGTLETSVGLEEEVEREGVSNGVVDNGTSGKISSSVEVALVETEESHVVPLGTDHEGDLQKSALFLSIRHLLKGKLTLGLYLGSISRAAWSMALYSILPDQLISLS